MRIRALLVTLLFLSIAAGCDSPRSRSDAGDGDTDPPSRCARDEDCANGTFCDGVERCAPGASDADRFGCAPPAAPPCLSGQRCQEAARECVTDCSVGTDADGDGAAALECGGPDCDDSDARRAPGLDEICDEGDVDEDCDPSTFGSRDDDDDGFIDALCCNGADDARTCGDDCDDADGSASPSGSEACGGGDEDCDGRTDEDVGDFYYPDRDGDGFGDGSEGTFPACVPPPNAALNGDDCDDSEARAHPGRTDVCDGLDNDCDGMIDEPGDRIYYRDADGDMRGDPGNTVTRTDCTIPAGYLPAAGDCDDTNAAVHVGAPEICDGLDTDCSEGGGVSPDEDADGDGHGRPGASCAGGGFPLDDCDDMDPAIRPGATETCTGADDDCDGTVDEMTDDACGPTQACVGGTCQSARRLAVSNGHVCVLRAGEPWCWGANDVGQLGDGSTTHRPSPARVPGLSGIAGLAGGDDFTCARDAAGAVRCWGSNSDGQLGRDPATTASLSTPTVVMGVPPVVEIAAGLSHVCGRTADGAVWCWGNNGNGQLGDGTITSRHTPGMVSGITDVAQLALGYYHSCFRTAIGEVWCVGYNGSGQLGDGSGTDQRLPVRVAGISDATVIAATNSLSCAVRPDTSVFCWGTTSLLGAGAVGTSGRTVPGVSGAIDLAMGFGNVCALRAAGTVQCWGSNSYGALNDGTVERRASPIEIPGLTDVIALDSLSSAWCAEHRDGTVSCWGRSLEGQLGDGLGLGPQPVVGITGAIRVGAGREHTCVVHAGGTVSCFGGNASGQLGDGTQISRTTPVPVTGLTSIVHVEGSTTLADAPTGFTCALQTTTGTSRALWCWGSNAQAQLGTSTPALSTEPLRVTGVLVDTALALGDQHTCAGPSAWSTGCWGGNGYFQLGCSGGCAGPTPVYQATRHSDVAAAARTTCALRASDSAAFCWGEASGSLFGVDSASTTPVPTRIPGVNGVEIDGGRDMMCVRTAAGSVVCWGSNNMWGQRGNGTTGFVSAPTTVSGITDAAELAVGGMHACVRHASGRVSCWGRDALAVGAGERAYAAPCYCTSTPRSVVGLTDAVAIAAGESHACAVRATGQVVCWGQNDYGQLGVARMVRVPGLP